MKFCHRIRLKCLNDRGEFELDGTRTKNNIAENLFALGHEPHNRSFTVCIWVCFISFLLEMPYIDVDHSTFDVIPFEMFSV